MRGGGSHKSTSPQDRDDRNRTVFVSYATTGSQPGKASKNLYRARRRVFAAVFLPMYVVSVVAISLVILIAVRYTLPPLPLGANPVSSPSPLAPYASLPGHVHRRSIADGEGGLVEKELIKNFTTKGGRTTRLRIGKKGKKRAVKNRYSRGHL